MAKILKEFEQAKYIEITTPYTLTVINHYVSYTESTDATVTLPSVGSGTASFAGRIYEIKKTSTSNLTVVASDGILLRTKDAIGVASFTIPPGYYIQVVNNSNITSGTWDISFLGSTDVIK